MALIVEDGTGTNPDAESYISAGNADSYFDKFGYPSGWEQADAEDQERSLRKATRWIDFNVNFYGEKLEKDQPLGFPRTAFVDSAGNFIDEGVIPTILKHATADTAGIDINVDIDKIKIARIQSERYGSTEVRYAGSVLEEGSVAESLKPIMKWLSRFGSLDINKVDLLRS